MTRRRLTTALTGATLLAGILFAAHPAAAKEVSHRLREGETIAGLARHYYGAGWKAVYILGRNGMGSAKEAKVGQRLYIPASWTYTVRRGDYPSKLAKRYLGGADRHEALTQMNGIKKGKELEVGQELVMPFHATYVVQRGDSLSAISRRFYRTTRRANMLKAYNGGSSALQPGDKVVAPIFDRATLEVRKKGPPPAPQVTATPEPKPEPKATPEEEPATEAAEEPAPEPEPPAAPVSRKDAIDRAVAAYLDGDFGPAAEQLEEVLDAAADNPLPPAELATTLRYLGFCAVAFDDPDMAREYFRQWLELDPAAKLDPVQSSPKIISVFDQVAAEVRD